MNKIKNLWSSTVKGTSIGRPSINGRVFALSCSKASKSFNLIQCNCLLSGNTLIVMFDGNAIIHYVSLLC